MVAEPAAEGRALCGSNVGGDEAVLHQPTGILSGGSARRYAKNVIAVPFFSRRLWCRTRIYIQVNIVHTSANDEYKPAPTSAFLAVDALAQAMPTSAVHQLRDIGLYGQHVPGQVNLARCECILIEDRG